MNFAKKQIIFLIFSNSLVISNSLSTDRSSKEYDMNTKKSSSYLDRNEGTPTGFGGTAHPQERHGGVTNQYLQTRKIPVATTFETEKQQAKAFSALTKTPEFKDAVQSLQSKDAKAALQRAEHVANQEKCKLEQKLQHLPHSWKNERQKLADRIKHIDEYSQKPPRVEIKTTINHNRNIKGRYFCRGDQSSTPGSVREFSTVLETNSKNKNMPTTVTMFPKSGAGASKAIFNKATYIKEQQGMKNSRKATKQQRMKNPREVAKENFLAKQTDVVDLKEQNSDNGEPEKEPE